jgi:hypothetical protein
VRGTLIYRKFELYAYIYRDDVRQSGRSGDGVLAVVGWIEMMIEYSTVRGWVGQRGWLIGLDPELNVALLPPPPPSVPTIINDLIHPQYQEAWSRLLKGTRRERKAG